jgi:MarR family transcriptional regulator for hemolysin
MFLLAMPLCFGLTIPAPTQPAAQYPIVEPATLVSVIDRMERDGLLARESDPDDRRRKIIKPLPKAQPVWKKVAVCAERVQARATKGMTKKQLRTLTELLQIVEANVSGAKQIMQAVS